MSKIKLFQASIVKATAEMKAVPVGANGKRNGNALRKPYHALAGELQEQGYSRFDAYRIANEVRAKF